MADFREQQLIETYGAWQVISAVAGMLGGKKAKLIDFEDYARSLGLVQDDPEAKTLHKELRKQKTHAEKETALEKARRIVNLDRTKGSKVQNSGIFQPRPPIS